MTEQTNALSEYKYQPEDTPQPGAMTHAQARIDAVSTVLHAAIQRASTLELTAEEISKLKADFPDEAFKPGASGKEHLIYIEHAFLRDRMDEALGMGRWTVVRTRPHWAEEFTTQKNEHATRIYAECALVVRGCYCGEAIGEMVYYPNNASQNYGDAAEGAVTAAFRRLAKNFGVGLQAWKKDFGEGWKQRQRGGAAPRKAPQPVPAPASAPTPQSRSAATAATASGATAKTREWMIASLVKDCGEINVAGWAVDQKILIYGEALTAWPLHMVPTTGQALRGLSGEISAWLAAKAPADEPAEPAERTQAFWTQVVVVPRAGTKRVDYMLNPDTIASLYDSMKAGDDAARKRLFGLAKEWTPQPYVGSNGQTYQPSAADLKCRESMDAFLDWEETK